MGLALKKTTNNTTNNKKYQPFKLNNGLDTANVSANNSNYNPRTVSFKKIVKDIQIWKWMDRFNLEYNGNLLSRDIDFKYGADCYRIDLKGVKGIGFIRIVHHLKFRMGQYNCLAEIYIEPTYRKEGIYDYILSNNCSGVKVDSVMVSSDVYIKYSSFFTNKEFRSTPYERGYHILVK